MLKTLHLLTIYLNILKIRIQCKFYPLPSSKKSFNVVFRLFNYGNWQRYCFLYTIFHIFIYKYMYRQQQKKNITNNINLPFNIDSNVIWGIYRSNWYFKNINFAFNIETSVVWGIYHIDNIWKELCFNELGIWL